MEVFFIVRCIPFIEGFFTRKVYLQNKFVKSIISLRFSNDLPLLLRYLNHLAKLIDAVHILCGSKISFAQLKEAKLLLQSFVDEFEQFYGESRMVFNIHLLTHLAECVKFIGPLPCYSNYHFEDYIGRLVALHKGTTDVSTQICEKYLLEKHLFYHLDRSPIAHEFYQEIHSKHNISVCRKVAGTLMIGNGKQSLSEEEFTLIVNALNIPNETPIEKFDAMLFKSKIYYEIESKSFKKKTNDSFIFNVDRKCFGTIDSIIVVDENIFVLVNEKYQQIVDKKNTCKYSIPLKELNVCAQNVWKAESIGFKYALVKFNDTVACSRFPNMYERN